MRALVFGSLNIDKVYTLENLPEKGETLRCGNYEIHIGGKGLNQAIALKKAGFDTYIAGAIGEDGLFLEEHLKICGIDTKNLLHCDGFTGHAVIEVDKNGQNQMILFAGANYKITPDYCDRVLSDFEKGDLIVMQYETSCVEYMIEKAHEKGLIVVVNPSPFVKEVKDLPYGKIDFLFLNEEEGQKITDKSATDAVIDEILKKMSDGKIVLTLGGDGAVFADKTTRVKIPAFKVKAVDTTGAGDTFTGFFLSSFLSGKSPEAALKFASAASATVVTKKGAAETIPTPEEVKLFIKTYGKTDKPWSVFLDIDGTLIGSKFELSEKNAEIIDKVRDAGHYVFVNTGRALGNIPEEFDTIKKHLDGVIAGSGSYFEFKGKEIYGKCFDKETVKEAAGYLLNQNELWAVFECKEGIIGLNSVPEAWNITKTVNSADDFDSVYSDIHVEVIAVGKCPTKEFCDKFGEKMRIIPLGSFADCLNFGYSKSEGMKYALDMLNIPIERSIAIGDSNNDLDMLNAAGISVAMKNASGDVLKSADIITAANTEDGVAAALEKILLISREQA